MRSLKIALIVGTILNIINQYEGMMGFAPVVWWKAALTYCVPFCVSTYAAWSALKGQGGM